MKKTDVNNNTVQLRNSSKIALSGVMSALCIAIMFLTAFFPFFEYVTPLLASLFLTILVLETGFTNAMVAYLATSILSLITTPNKESAILFCVFFGYYGIIRTKIEGISSKLFKNILKTAIFNLSMILFYYIVKYVLGVVDVISEFGDFGKYSIIILLIIINISFWLYDFTIGNIINVYYNIIRPKYIKGKK